MPLGHADVVQPPTATDALSELENVQSRDDHNHGGPLRRSLERMRGISDPKTGGDSLADRESLTLEVMLLREEIARLRTARHRPTDIGTFIDQLRGLAAEQGEADMEDEVWSLLAETRVIREELEQACVELELAIAAVRRRLRSLSVSLDQNGLGHQDTGDSTADTER
jgi:hypothetical protein